MEVRPDDSKEAPTITVNVNVNSPTPPAESGVGEVAKAAAPAFIELAATTVKDLCKSPDVQAGTAGLATSTAVVCVCCGTMAAGPIVLAAAGGVVAGVLLRSLWGRFAR